MNPISIVTGAITHPVRTAGALTQQAYGVAATGVRTTLQLIDWAASQGRGHASGPAAEPSRVAADEPADSVFTTGEVPATVVPEEPAVTESATAPAERTAAQKAPARKAPAKKAPAKKAPAKKAAAKKAPAKKAPAKKAPAKKAPARKAPSARAATIAPALAPEVLEQLEDEALDAEGPTTPSGIPAADVAHNPDTTDTDLHQPGTPPVMDPGTVNAVLSESETLRKAADTDKG